ncbi:MAG: bifunctional acetate--CoA ligase family protein/GNAT family N-acetyltransferase [Bauldia sp.]
MTIRNLEFAFRAKSIAVIGASTREGSVGQKVMRNVQGAGFAGAIWPVNPHYESLYGLQCWPTVAALPGAPDLAVIATPAATVPGLIAELGARGNRAAVVLTAGLTRESGLRQTMLEAARPYNLRIIGPNGLGLFVPAIGLNASFAHLTPSDGKLAFLSQSGALASAVLDWAVDRRIGFSTVVSLGDMADVDVADLLDMLAGDGSTDAVLLYLETVINTRKFMSAARAAARMKPVIVIKSGRSPAAAKAAATHTGALAGADGVIDAAFRRSGLLRVRDLEDLFDAAETLARFRPIERGRLGIVTNGGGAGVLAVDRLVDFGGELSTLSPQTIAALDAALPATWSHGNPVDIIGDAGPERYDAAIAAVFADANVDALLVMACPTALASAEGSAEAVAATVKRLNAEGSQPYKPVLTSWLGEHDAAPARARLREAGIATYDTPADAVESLSYLTGYSQAQRALSRTPPDLPTDFTVDAAAARALLAKVAAEGRTTLTEPEAKAVLACFGIPVVETHVAERLEDVEGIAAELLGRTKAIAVKLLSRDVSHKSDVGGVVLGLRSAAAAKAAAGEIIERLKANVPTARIDGFTVQAMVDRPNAHELIVGVNEDNLFGPIILFGAGGTSVEVVADTAIALPPLDLKLAHDLIGQTRIAKLLAGYRDRAPADVDAVALALVRVSQMVIDCPEIGALDINPLLADSNGVIAVDARVVIDPKRIGDKAPNERLAIRPYPSAWEKRVRTLTGRELNLRPIRPEDARLYPDFTDKLEGRDLRLRVLAPRKFFAHDFLARLTQIDYAREMAFVALDPESGALLGVSRLVADPDYTRAEYAVIVRSDVKGTGIGWSLMEHLIAYARAEGLKRLEGTVLAENTRMLEMCRQLGFSVEPDPDNAGSCAVRIDLAAKPAAAAT